MDGAMPTGGRRLWIKQDHWRLTTPSSPTGHRQPAPWKVACMVAARPGGARRLHMVVPTPQPSLRVEEELKARGRHRWCAAPPTSG